MDTLFALPRRKSTGRPRKKGRAVVKGVRFAPWHPVLGQVAESDDCRLCRTWSGLSRELGRVRAWCRLRRQALELISLMATDDEGETWRPMSEDELRQFLNYTKRGERK